MFVRLNDGSGKRERPSRVRGIAGRDRRILQFVSAVLSPVRFSGHALQRIERYLAKSLAHSLLQPIKLWYQAHLPRALGDETRAQNP